METTPSSGNVFEDLGFVPEAASNLTIRAALMLQLEQFMEEQGWTQQQAALQFGVTQPRISDLKRGKIDRFSIDMLVRMLSRAGLRVEFRILPRTFRQGFPT
jgi:predicted XRE-type DNA-binding protein